LPPRAKRWTRVGDRGARGRTAGGRRFQCILSVVAESRPRNPWVGLLARKERIAAGRFACRFTFPGCSAEWLFEAANLHSQWRDRAGFTPDFPFMPSWAPKARWDASTTRCFMREKLWLIKYNWWEEGTTWQTHHPISASALLVATSLPRAQWTRRRGRNTTSRSRHQGQHTDRPRRGSRESPGVPTRFTRLEEGSTGKR
jgi:hypothetical protein